jgi:hypothetical protein
MKTRVNFSCLSLSWQHRVLWCGKWVGFCFTLQTCDGVDAEASTPLHRNSLPQTLQLSGLGNSRRCPELVLASPAACNISENHRRFGYKIPSPHPRRGDHARAAERKTPFADRLSLCLTRACLGKWSLSYAKLNDIAKRRNSAHRVIFHHNCIGKAASGLAADRGAVNTQLERSN